MGMIGSITSMDFVIGIALAIVILIIFALLFRFIVKLIPIYYIFRVLSILIFIMAFKMLGVSIQKLQLLGSMVLKVYLQLVLLDFILILINRSSINI